MSALAVEIRDKTYPARAGKSAQAALTDLRFAVPDGQFVCLVGPSGCGKTTLLNLIGGLDSDYDGSVGFDADRAGHDRRPGFMFQSPRLMPWLTVRQNVELVAGTAAERERGRDLLAHMGLSEVLDAYPGALSGGMQRRVALARAFAIAPRLLLLDEPFVSLDQPIAERLRALLLDLWQARPTTVLFVTHDVREALSLADRILFLSATPGRLVHDLPVALPRPRHIDDPAVEAERRRLLAARPGLLAGLGDVLDGAPAGQRSAGPLARTHRPTPPS